MLDKVKEYLKIDTDAEDNYLKTLITATEQYVSSGLDNDNNKNTALFENAQLMLIWMLYNNRGLTEGKENSTLKLIFNAIMLKLKTSEDIANGTSTDEK